MKNLSKKMKSNDNYFCSRITRRKQLNRLLLSIKKWMTLFSSIIKCMERTGSITTMSTLRKPSKWQIKPKLPRSELQPILLIRKSSKRHSRKNSQR